jgi:hypothetical protein
MSRTEGGTRACEDMVIRDIEKVRDMYVCMYGIHNYYLLTD